MKKSLLVKDFNKLENEPPEVAIPLEGSPMNPRTFIGGTGCSILTNLENKLVYIYIIGVIRSINDYAKAIKLMHELTEEFTIHIYIHSPGGSVAAGCNFLTAMERCKATIITHNLGIAASCGSLILAFGDKINIPPNTITMFHNALQGSRDSVHRLLSQTQHTINFTMQLFTMMRDRGLITTEEIEGIVKRGDEYYLTGTMMAQRLQKAGLWYEGVR